MAVISFILPIYNTPLELLKKSIEKIIENPSCDIEVILIDDGSKENIAKVCDYYSKLDSRVIAFHQKNQGVSVARNYGINKARGKYIIFVDPDDYVLESVFDIDYFKNEDSDIILFDYIRKTKNEDKEYIKINTQNRNLNRLELIKNTLFCDNDYGNYYAGAVWAKAFLKKFLINNNLFFDETLRKAQDRVFMLYVYEKASKISKKDKVTYVYYENMNSICNSYNKNAIQRSRKFIYAVENFLSDVNIEESINDYILAKVYFVSYFEIIYLDVFNFKNTNKFLVKVFQAKELYKELNIKKRITALDYKSCSGYIEKIKLFLIRHKMFGMLYLLIYQRQKKRCSI